MSLTGLYLPSTYVLDISKLQGKSLDSVEFQQLWIRLVQYLNNMSNAVNQKDTGYYVLEEFINSQLFFANPTLSSATAQAPSLRNVFRKVINYGALPNASSRPEPHGITITPTTTFTRIYGVATNPSNAFIPLPYAAITDNQNIELSVDATNVIITTGIDRTAFTTTYVVLEYLKN